MVRFQVTWTVYTEIHKNVDRMFQKPPALEETKAELKTQVFRRKAHDLIIMPTSKDTHLAML